jgi:hypothetical protein
VFDPPFTIKLSFTTSASETFVSPNLFVKFYFIFSA